MNVIRSAVMGFCSGVSRAVKMAETVIEQNSADSLKKIYSFGPLIHNEAVLADLERRGLKILSEKEIPFLDRNSVVLIRAHGVSPEILKAISDTGAAVADATCPRVALNQKRAAEFSADGFTVILAGDAGHGEAKAIHGSAGERFVLVQNALEAESFVQTAGEKGAVLFSQTTFSPYEFKKIAEVLSQKIPSLEVIDTICPAMQHRQNALLEMAGKVDAIVVIGGKKSANTIRLYELGISLGKKTFFVESAGTLPEKELCEIKNALGSDAAVGITAGASTSARIIDAVESAIRGL